MKLKKPKNLILMNTKHCLLACGLMLAAATMQAQVATDGATDSVVVAELDEHVGGSGADVVDQPDVMPTFPGGVEAIGRVLSRELEYPKKEMKKGVQGRVIVSFVVQTNGKVGDVKVMKSVSPGLDAEAVRAVKQLRGWNPGTKNGQPVNTRYTLPVNFKLP
jgi:TonB family protein